MDRGLETSGKTVKGLIADLGSLIDDARKSAAQAVGATIVMLYWHLGDRIRQDILGRERADYGSRVVAMVSQQLTAKYGRGFTKDNLSRMINLAAIFPREIVTPLSKQLGWSHFVQLLPIEDPLKREFYAEMCRQERWSVRGLRGKIAGMLFERTALSRKPADLARLEIKKLREEDRLSADLVFRDPYFLDFLGLRGAYQEKDLEAAILREMESFILELGDGFTFAARQKRLQIGGSDYYLDLLFYHRKLKRLVAIELKLDRFRPEFKGQMELYLRWLEKHEVEPGEDPPIGLILCAGKNQGEIELLQLDRSGIRVAEYMTELPPRTVLEKKLNETIAIARQMLGTYGRGG